MIRIIITIDIRIITIMLIIWIIKTVRTMIPMIVILKQLMIKKKDA